MPRPVVAVKGDVVVHADAHASSLVSQGGDGRPGGGLAVCGPLPGGQVLTAAAAPGPAAQAAGDTPVQSPAASNQPVSNAA